MKKLNTNLAVAKSTVAVFEKSKQKEKQNSSSSWACTYI
jgi:hypothetical protein